MKNSNIQIQINMPKCNLIHRDLSAKTDALKKKLPINETAP